MLRRMSGNKRIKSKSEAKMMVRNYQVDTEVTTELCDNVAELLSEYGHLSKEVVDIYGTPEGLDKMYGPDGIYWQNKGWLIDILKGCANYVGNGRVIWKSITVNRYVNPDFFNQKFRDFMSDKLYDAIMAKYDGDYRKTYDASDVWREILIPIHKLINQAADSYQKEALLLPKDVANKINEIGMEKGFDFRVTPGKLSKAIQKIGKVFGLDKIKDEKTITWMVDGTEHTKVKDFGWNYMFAQLADSINPCEWCYDAILSINPLDFYTMSFGSTWASCHTIDKKNQRGLNDIHHYSGMYCGGCESYALDNNSLIFYYIKAGSADGKNIWEVGKEKRMIVYFNGETMVSSRLYPDGRDSTHSQKTKDGIITRIQNAIAEGMGIAPSAWAFREDAMYDHMRDAECSAHYADYSCYPDIVTSHLVTNNGLDLSKMVIGHVTICPECGDVVHDDGELACGNCKPSYCKCCGSWFDGRRSGWSDWNNSVCEDCFVGTCDGCGSVITTDMDYISNDDGIYCDDCTESCTCCGAVYNRSAMTLLYINDSFFSNGCICNDCIDSDDNYIRTYDGYVTTRQYAQEDTDGHVFARCRVNHCSTCGGYHRRNMWNYELEEAHDRMRARGQMRPISQVQEEQEDDTPNIPDFSMYDNDDEDEEVDEYGFAIIHDED